MEAIRDFNNDLVWLTLPKVEPTDIIEIIILAFLLYHVVKWVKNTRAWTLVKGLVVIMFFWYCSII